MGLIDSARFLSAYFFPENAGEAAARAAKELEAGVSAAVSEFTRA
jgi:hypothetical protein